MSRLQQFSNEDHFHNIPLETVESHWKILFDQFDHDGDGKIPLSYLKAELIRDNHHVPEYVVHKIIAKADENRDGYITYSEFVKFVESSPVHSALVNNRLNRYVKSFVPRTRRPRIDTVDGSYEAQYTCVPPPVFMLVISIFEICVYLYDVAVAHNALSVHAPGFVMLVYNPHRRAEIWRFVTYMFIHSNEAHLTVNLLVQLMLGIPLEMVHRWWRIMIIYFAGVISGSLFTSVADPNVFLAGASGGVYAIITAHIATIVMNWNEMDYPLIQLLVFVTLAFLDMVNAIYHRYIAKVDTKIGYAAHLAGAVAGFLVGVYVLRNLKVYPWERILWWVCCIVYAVLVVFVVCWNLFYPDYFPPQFPFGKYLYVT